MADEPHPTKNGPEPETQPPAKRPYKKPSFEWERAFETMALACGKVNVNQFQCKTNRKNS